MSRENFINLDGQKPFSPERRRTQPKAWQEALLKLKDEKGHGYCKCNGKGLKRLDPFQRGTLQYLRRAPNSGPEHAHDCEWFGFEPNRSGYRDYLPEARTERADGRMSLQLSVGLTQAESPSGEFPTGASFGSSGGQQRGQPRVTPLGLLSFLWERSRFHVWHPEMAGKRIGTVFAAYIRTAAEHYICSRKDLHEVLVILPPGNGTRPLYPNHLANIAALERCHRNKGRVVVVGELECSREQGEVSVLHKDRHISVELPPNTLDQVNTRISGHLSQIRGLSECVDGRLPRVVFLGVGTPEKIRTDWKVKLAVVAFMVTTADYIPVESSHEWRLAEHLRGEGRFFNKPLRYDAGSGVPFPDFVLLDTQQVEYPMEVFGMATEAYKARQAEKEAYYLAEYGLRGWWCWKVTEGAAMPTLPEVMKTVRS